MQKMRVGVTTLRLYGSKKIVRKPLKGRVSEWRTNTIPEAHVSLNAGQGSARQVG